MMCNRNQVPKSSTMAVMLRTVLSKKCFPKFAKDTLHFFRAWVGRIVRCHSKIFTRLVNRKSRRIKEFGRRSKARNTKCGCPKCSRRRLDQRKRAMSADFVANLGHSNRACNTDDQIQDDEEVEGLVTNSSSSCNVCVKKNFLSNTKDVRVNKDGGQAWWASKLERREYMLPVGIHSIEKATESKGWKSCLAGAVTSSIVTNPATLQPFLNNLISMDSSILKSEKTENPSSSSFLRRDYGSKSEPRNLPWSLRGRKGGDPKVKVMSARFRQHERVKQRRASIRPEKYTLDCRRPRAHKTSSV